VSHKYDPTLTDRQKQIIIGTILGGSSLVQSAGGRSHYLSMRDRNSRWLRYKAEELACLASDRPFTSDVTNRWHSMCYPIFNQLHDEFYEGRERRLKAQTLDALKDVAFGIWFADCGKFKQGKITLNTHVWGEKGTKLIIRYFGYLGYEAEMVCERKCYRVRLGEESSSLFFTLANPHLPLWFIEENVLQQVPSHE
jgi:hypothetical protein